MYQNNSKKFQNKYFLDSLLFAVLAGLLILFLFKGTEKLGYNWQWFRIPEFIFKYDDGQFIPGPLLQGLWVTLKISAISFVLTFAIGLATAILRLSNSFVSNSLSRVYLETVRNTPLLIQLFLFTLLLRRLSVSTDSGLQLLHSVFLKERMPQKYSGQALLQLIKVNGKQHSVWGEAKNSRILM